MVNTLEWKATQSNNFGTTYVRQADGSKFVRGVWFNFIILSMDCKLLYDIYKYIICHPYVLLTMVIIIYIMVGTVTEAKPNLYMYLQNRCSQSVISIKAMKTMHRDVKQWFKKKKGNKWVRSALWLEKKNCVRKRKYAESCGIFIVLFPGITVTSPPLKRPTGDMKHMQGQIGGRSIRECKHPLNPWSLWGCIDLFSLSSTWSVIS